MKEGYWININTGEKWKIHEHASFAKSHQGAAAMALPQSVRDEIAAYSSDFNGKGREAIVIAVCKAGYIRMRGHGTAWTFEFWEQSNKALQTIQQLVAEWAGPYTHIQIHNLQNNEQWNNNAKEFLDCIKTGGFDAILCAAKNQSKLVRRDHHESIS